MTDEEFQMQLANRIGYVPGPAPAPAPAPAPMPSEQDSFASRMLGHAPSLALGLASPGMAPIMYGRSKLDPGPTPGIWPVSTAAQGALAQPPPPEPASAAPVPMDTPLAPVAGAPALNPQLAQVTRPMGAGGGGGGVNPLKARYDAAQQRQLGAFGEQKELTNNAAVAHEERMEGVASREEAMAAKQQKDALELQEVERKAAAQHQAFLSRNEELADQIGKMKTDPGRLMRDMDTGTKLVFAIGAGLGGFLRGVQGGGRNSVLDHMDKMIDRDIAAQQSDIDNAKASLTARSTIFGQLMQETGDRRLAGMQFRGLVYEAAKLKLKSDADRLGIPEAKTAAALEVNKIEHAQAGLNENMAATAWKTYLQQQAAAAAAARAAEEKAYQRQKDLLEYGLKVDHLRVEAAKAGKEGRVTHDKQLQDLAKDLANPEQIQARVGVEGAMRRLIDPKTGKVDPKKGLPGVGHMADAREALTGRPTGLNSISPLAWAAHEVAGPSAEDRVSRQDWNQLKLGYRHLITGSGGSEKEMADISSAFEGANTPQEQANAVQKLYDTVNRLEQTKKAGYDTAVVDEFEAKMKGTGGAGMPASVRVKR